jgi:hypothetical protein
VLLLHGVHRDLHGPQTSRLTKKEPNSGLRWRLCLGSYDYWVLYKPGKDNLCADALSRFIDQETKEIQIFYLQNGPRPRQMDLRVFLAEEKRDTRRPSSSLINLKHSKLPIKTFSNVSSENEFELY